MIRLINFWKYFKKPYNIRELNMFDISLDIHTLNFRGIKFRMIILNLGFDLMIGKYYICSRESEKEPLER